MTHLEKQEQHVEQHVLSRESADSIIRRIQAMAQGGGHTLVQLDSVWYRDVQWARNRVSLLDDRTRRTVTVLRALPGYQPVQLSVNQLDDDSLAHLVRAAERIARADGVGLDLADQDHPIPALSSSTDSPAIHSDATERVSTDERVKLVQRLTRGAETEGFLSAGSLFLSVSSRARSTPIPFLGITEGLSMFTAHRRRGGRISEAPGLEYYHVNTIANCSMTVRHPQGKGSGWAGITHYDWNKIDPIALADRALEKCRASVNPAAVEPGRYTVILEPQAVHDLAGTLLSFLNGREDAESNAGPFAQGFDSVNQINRSRLGLKIVDERLTIQHDPSDPELGIAPEQGLGPVTWIERGILKSLGYSRFYALDQLSEQQPVLTRYAFRLDVAGPLVTTERMIATTRRGLLVTRLSGVGFSSNVRFNTSNAMFAGSTRDGLWLIEDGKIKTPVKNMTFVDSPLFAFNQIEQAGASTKIFGGAVVPTLKIRDFSFVSLSDAI